MHSLKCAIEPACLSGVAESIMQRRALKRWQAKGRPVPPPAAFKHGVVKQYAEKFSIRTLVETGTALGGMVRANRDTFDRIYSVELDRHLWERARRRFRRFRHIHIVPGNSGGMLPFVLNAISEPCLFWLDAHQMVGGARGELVTPIRRELQHVLEHGHPDHVILIDDARLFTGQGDYPTLDEVRAIILRRHPEWVFEVKDDIIRAHSRLPGCQ